MPFGHRSVPEPGEFERLDVATFVGFRRDEYLFCVDKALEIEFAPPEIADAADKIDGVEMSRRGPEGRLVSPAFVHLDFLDDLQGASAVLAGHPEGPAARFPLVFHHPADAKGPVELPDQGLSALFERPPLEAGRQSAAQPIRGKANCRADCAFPRCALRELLQVAEELPLQPDQVPTENLLVQDRRVLEPVGDDIVDVLDEHDVPVDAVQIVEQGAVPSRPEEKTPVAVPEGTVFEIHGDRVRRFALNGKPDLEVHTEAILIETGDPAQEVFHRLQVLFGNGEVDPAQSAAVLRVEGRLHEMLLEGRPRPVVVLVKLQERLGFPGVMKSLVVEDEIEELPAPAPGDKIPQVMAGPGKRRIQVPVKGIPGKVCRKGLEILAAFESAPVEHTVPLPEHARGGARGRDKLQASPGLRRLVVEGHKALAFSAGYADDPVAERRRPLEGHRHRPETA